MGCDTKWIESAGGPLVVLASSKTHLWRGVETEDYAAACEVEDYVGILERSWGQVLVLNDEPLRTAVVRSERGVDVLRWMYAPNEEQLLAASAVFDVRSQEPVERLCIHLVHEAYSVIDSGACGGDAERLTFEPPPRSHSIATYVVRLEEIGFVLHCFEE